MRILYFSRDYSTHDHRFLSALAQTEHQVAYLRLEQRGHALEDRPLPPQIEQVQWRGGQQPFSYRLLFPLLQDLGRVIRQFQPDVIQAGPIQTAAFLVALSLLTTWQSGRPRLVSMSWGYDLLHDAHQGWIMDRITRFTLGSSSALVGDCAPIRQAAIAFGMPDSKIVTFPWGVDLEHFTPDEPEKPSPPAPPPFWGEGSGEGGANAPLVLLSTRSWELIYGVDVLAKGFALAAQEHPELRLIMLGNGSLAGQLRQVFNRHNVSEQVFFPGQVSQTDLPRYYRQADLYVSASRTDGTSISLLEALACGTPALLSDIPGNREWLDVGVQGWYFKDGDPEALCQAILQACAQHERLPEMGQAARALAERRADWKKNFQMLFQAYGKT